MNIGLAVCFSFHLIWGLFMNTLNWKIRVCIYSLFHINPYRIVAVPSLNTNRLAPCPCIGVTGESRIPEGQMAYVTGDKDYELFIDAKHQS